MYLILLIITIIIIIIIIIFIIFDVDSIDMNLYYAFIHLIFFSTILSIRNIAFQSNPIIFEQYIYCLFLRMMGVGGIRTSQMYYPCKASGLPPDYLH